MSADEYQLSIFDFYQQDEPAVGEYVEGNGANICHIMRPSYIGKKVIYDCSTVSHKWLRCGILEKYFFCEGVWRSIIYVGERQRILLDHFPGVEIFEPLPWDKYLKRRDKCTTSGTTTSTASSMRRWMK